MIYKLTLLKDLPKYPAGTEFVLNVDRRLTGERFNEIKYKDYYMRLEYPQGINSATDIEKLERENKDYCYYNRILIPLEIIDDPGWIKKEVYQSKYYDSRCPRCHSTRFLLHIRPYRSGNQYNGYYNTTDITFECECGHIYNIYKGK